MALYLIRHAKAGKKSKWDGPDTTRPLDRAGWTQAMALACKMNEINPTWLVSSPYVRCMQTLQHLGEHTGLQVFADDRLAEDSDTAVVIDMLEHAPDGAVMCSHGDVIPAVIRALQNRGMRITTTPDWRKASVWELYRNGTEFVDGAAWPPPQVVYS